MSRAPAPRWRADAAAVLAAACGLALSFPPFDLWPLAWLAPAPLLARARAGSPARALALGAAWGALFFAGSLYWAHSVMTRYGGLSGWVAFGPLVLLVLYCASYHAAFLWAVALGARRWGNRALWAAPALWAALEYLRARALGGIPWALLAYSQQAFPPALAPAAWGGAYAVSSLIVLCWVWLVRVGSPGGSRAARLATAAAGVAAALALWAAGGARARSLEARPADLRVACVQVNVPQAIKWSRAHRQEVLAAHRELSLQAAAAGARLIVWPESSLPFEAGESVPAEAGDVPIEAWVAEQARDSGADILWGGTASALRDGRHVLLNSAFLTLADGRTTSRYDKMRLVPFGEYVPLQPVLAFAQPLVRRVGEFAPGREPVLHRARELTLGSVICYEILFPHVVRGPAANGAHLLVNITNDAWFGDSVAPYLHLAAAPLRAVEEGFAVVRAANTGISALVSPSGRVLAATRLGERALLVGDVPSRGVSTFYRRHGDGWAAACAMMTAIYLASLSPRIPRPAPARRPRAEAVPAPSGHGGATP